MDAVNTPPPKLTIGSEGEPEPSSQIPIIDFLRSTVAEGSPP